jgi:ferredoxin
LLNPILQLQQTVGNQAVQRLLQSRALQAKLKISRPGDIYEQEADRVAEQVMRMPEPMLQRSCAGCGAGVSHCPQCEDEKEKLIHRKTPEPSVHGEEDEDSIPCDVEEGIENPNDTEEGQIRRKSRNSVEGDGGAIESALNSPQGGQSLESSVRRDMEQRIGAGFSGVKVHTDSGAAQMNRRLNARAFTHGSDIYFGEGEYHPGSSSGRLLIAHELVHVVQQGGSSARFLIQRQPKKKAGAQYVTFQVLVPGDYTTLEQMYRLFERIAYGREVNHEWDCGGYCDMAKNRGKVRQFHALRSNVESLTDPETKKREEESKKGYEQLAGKSKQDITAEVNKRYYEKSGDKPGTAIKKGEEGKAQMWGQALDEVMKDKQTLESLPPEVKALMGPETSYKPQDYQHLLKVAEKLKKFTAEDLAVYKLLAIRATDNLDLFEKSVDMFLARKEELTRALEQQQPAGGDKGTAAKEADEKWKDFDESSIGTMSESDRYALARQKTSELTAAQLKHMKEHPGETLKEFAKSATLMNTGETFSAIGKDIQEAASGDANSWARWAAGTGAGAKLSGWLLAVAGILYVASWLTGIGELATIAAAAGILLASTITLSAVESELRIKAASQAKTPEEFKRNVELAAAARANVIVGVALIVIAAVLHFTAKAFFPKTLQKISLSLKNFRERVRLKGSVYDLKPKITAEMGSLKTELTKAAETAKQNALTAAEDINKLSTEQFAEKLETGDGGFLDQSKLPPEQKVNYRELLKTPEGRAAIEAYKAKLVNALKTDVINEIDRLAQEYGSKVDEFLKDVDAAKNHDDLKGAVDKIEGSLTEEHAKKFLGEEQEKITKQKLEEASQEAHKEAITLVKDAIVKRLKARITAQPDFALTYTNAELEGIITKGKELGLSDKTIEDLLYVGSRTAKKISAPDLMQQMENWAGKVKARGFPYKFADLAEFQRFSKDLIEKVRATGLPVDDVRVQGSSLRKETAADVDIAVFVEQSVFDKLLIDRFDGRITKGGAKVPLKGKSHAQLADVAADVKANPADYNAQAKTFQNAMETGIINSKSDIIKPLKTVRADIAAKYPALNLEAISVLIKGGLFDLLPDLPVKE